MVENEDCLGDSSLHAEMRAFVEGTRLLPISEARRHHFVPAFALAQFSSDARSRKSWIWQLDVDSGETTRTRPNDAAFDEHLYRYEDKNGALSNSVEAFFSIVEKHAAQALACLREDPGDLTPQDREVIAYFLVLQESRTPAGLMGVQRMRQAMFEIEAVVDLATSAGFRAKLTAAGRDPGTDDELEAQRLRMQKQLLAGAVQYEQPRTGAIRQIVHGVRELAQVVYRLDWTVLTADDAEFVTSDRPVSMHDPTPQHPWSGQAWNSSESAISFYALSPTKGLFMTPGDCGMSAARSAPAHVRRLNLMTFGWAEQRIYGTSEDVVGQVWEQSQRYPEEVVRRISHKQVILVPAEYHDPAVREEYRRRGWPIGFTVETDAGPRDMSYVLVDLDDGPGAAAAVMTQIIDGFSAESR